MIVLDSWMGLAVDDWARRWGVPRLLVLESVGSTNDLLRELAEAGAAAGTTVLAERQTRGRGRRGRSWEPAPGASLLLSMLFRPPRGGGETLLSLRLGLAAARAVEGVVPVTVGIKWPNDLWSGGHKIGGILCEGAVAAGGELAMVAGLGLNVGQADGDWPAELRGQASSLEARAGRSVDRAVLAGAVISEWRVAGAVVAGRLDGGELAEFHARDVLAGRAITVDERPAGIAAGIDAEGALLAAAGEGAWGRILAGTVRFDPNPGRP